MMISMEKRNAAAGVAELIATLESSGCRMTEARRAVAELISSHDGVFETADLVADARRRRANVARATIFRTLEILVARGAVERLDLPSGAHSYVRCESTRHHHHLICTRCQRSVDLEDIGMAAVVAEAERRTGYVVDHHRVELWGLCPSCQKATAAGERLA
jgi:Fur family ferric uptake transcriptional regulator